MQFISKRRAIEEIKMKKPLGELLVDEGYITKNTLQQALELQKTNKIMLGEALMTLDALTKGELIRFLSRHKENEEVQSWANQFLEQDEIDNLFKK